MAAGRQRVIVGLSIGRTCSQRVVDLFKVTYLGADVLPITRQNGSGQVVTERGVRKAQEMVTAIARQLTEE